MDIFLHNVSFVLLFTKAGLGLAFGVWCFVQLISIYDDFCNWLDSKIKKDKK